jgi:hypothetical protein
MKTCGVAVPDANIVDQRNRCGLQRVRFISGLRPTIPELNRQCELPHSDPHHTETRWRVTGLHSLTRQWRDRSVRAVTKREPPELIDGTMKFSVDGRRVSVEVETRALLVDVLRDQLG